MHHQAEGFASRAAIIDVPPCSGPEPWPANLAWYPDPDQRAALLEHATETDRSC